MAKREHGEKFKSVFIILVTIMGITSIGGLFTPPVITPRDQAATALNALDCLVPDSAAYHIHVTLEIVIDGETIAIPAGIGIEEKCNREIHTEDTKGTIHIESKKPKTYMLGDIFEVFGAPFNRGQIFNLSAGADHLITMTVNGAPSAAFETLVLEDNQAIRIEYAKALQEEVPPTLEEAAANQDIPPEVMEQLMQQMEEKKTQETQAQPPAID